MREEREAPLTVQLVGYRRADVGRVLLPAVDPTLLQAALERG